MIIDDYESLYNVMCKGSLSFSEKIVDRCERNVYTNCISWNGTVSTDDTVRR